MQYAYANNLLKLCKYLQTKLYYLSSSLMMLLTYKCNSRVKLKKFYSLKQSVLIHLLSKILAFSAFVAFKGLKRPKKAEKKTFAK